MKKLLPLLALAFCLNAKAQITFQKKISNINLFDMLQTNNGSYLFRGDDYLHNVVCIIKTNTIGDFLWEKTYKTTTGDTVAVSAINTTTDGGYIFAGTKDSSGWSTENIYLIKTDSLGNVMWTKLFKNAQGYFVQQTTDGGYIIGGRTSTYGAGNSDMYLIKTDSLGTIQWTKTYGTVNSDYLSFVQQTIDGGYMISGACNSPTFYFYIKTDASGNPTWVKNYNVSSSTTYRLTGGILSKPLMVDM